MKLNVISTIVIALIASSTLARRVPWDFCQRVCQSRYRLCYSTTGATAGEPEFLRYIFRSQSCVYFLAPLLHRLDPGSALAVITLGPETASSAASCAAIQGACMMSCTPLLVTPDPWKSSLCKFVGINFRLYTLLIGR